MKGKVFNTQEVQAIIAGNKTMFREVIAPQPILSPDKSYWEFKGIRWAGENSSYAKKFGDIAKPEMPEFAKFQVGQEIFVKEPFNIFCSQLVYKFSYKKSGRVFWMPASRMKQEHSRLTLRIKSVKVERLQDISEEDARKEGIVDGGCGNCGESEFVCKCLNKEPLPREDFIFNWNSTHKKQEHKWQADPWVFVYKFELIKP